MISASAEFAAIGYACLAAIAACVQIGLFFGAPWGVLTLGGKWPGTLPARMRPVALLQGTLLVAMAIVVLDRVALVDLPIPAAAFPVTVGITALSCVANWATPSLPERRLWGPVTLAMLLLLIAVRVSA